VFFGDIAACAECSAEYRPSFPNCLTCGAPAAMALGSRTIATAQPDSAPIASDIDVEVGPISNNKGPSRQPAVVQGPDGDDLASSAVSEIGTPKDPSTTRPKVASPSRSHRVYWSLLLIGAIVVAFAVPLLTPPGAVMSTPTILGTALGSATVVALAFTAVFGRLWRGMGAAAFFALFISIFLGNSIKDSYNASNAQNFASAMNDELMPSASNALAGKPDLTESAPKSQGDLGKIEGLLREMIISNATFQKEYEAALEASGVMELMSSERILSDTDGSETDKIVQAASWTVAQFEQRVTEEYEVFSEKVRTLSFQNKNTRTSFVNGFLKTAQETEKFSAEMWALEKEILRRQIAVARFLIANRGKWTVDVDNIYFEDDAAIDPYNSMQSQLTSAIEEQDALLQQRQKDFNALQEQYKTALATMSAAVP
jgi:hypothetical protein